MSRWRWKAAKRVCFARPRAIKPQPRQSTCIVEARLAIEKLQPAAFSRHKNRILLLPKLHTTYIYCRQVLFVTGLFLPVINTQTMRNRFLLLALLGLTTLVVSQACECILRCYCNRSCCGFVPATCTSPISESAVASTICTLPARTPTSSSSPLFCAQRLTS
jgi:hypothetical protein